MGIVVAHGCACRSEVITADGGQPVVFRQRILGPRQVNDARIARGYIIASSINQVGVPDPDLGRVIKTYVNHFYSLVNDV